MSIANFKESVVPAKKNSVVLNEYVNIDSLIQSRLLHVPAHAVPRKQFLQAYNLSRNQKLVWPLHIQVCLPRRVNGQRQVPIPVR